MKSQKIDSSIEIQAQPKPTVYPGSIHIELCLNSSITDHHVRSGLRSAFGTAMEDLIGNDISVGDLAGYMQGDLTIELPMKPSAGEMLIDLNRKGGYMDRIVAHCAEEKDIPLANYEAKVMHGTDSYCYGPEGQKICYHFFELIPKQGEGGPLTVEFGNEIGVITFSCRGQSND